MLNAKNQFTTHISLTKQMDIHSVLLITKTRVRN